ncbi:hypothetical protein [Sphingomonas crocodyli]|uniref:hypothetical protein n=1 Tax=Sphingomonas crocodyli TaxID=1979270 RepID=UPI0013E2FD1E|nr:hypothetical protein [Sphingomonas crocodyli]
MKLIVALLAVSVLTGCTDRGQCLHHEPRAGTIIIGGRVQATVRSVCTRWEFPEGRP